VADRLLYAKQGRTDGITREELLRFRETLEDPKPPSRGSLEALIVRPEWMSRAACKGVATDVFFPDRGDTRLAAKAKAYCQRCPVTAECLAEVMAMPRANVELGVWGNTSGYQRRQMIAASNKDSRPEVWFAPRPCQFCQELFDPRSRNTLYCSKRCKSARDNKSRWARRKGQKKAA
jgi:WhiB family transcriptional regulator, redox-sensing transcriptional regulator